MPRRKLNLDNMSPSLVLLNASSGELQQKRQLPDSQSSIRHLSINSEGVIGIALQQQDQRDVPLLAFYHDGELHTANAPDAIWKAAQRYSASVCLADDVPIAALTCPRGNLVSFWDSQSGDYIKQLTIRDAGGVAYARGYFWVTTGFGEIIQIDVRTLAILRNATYPQTRWDNHAVLMG